MRVYTRGENQSLVIGQNLVVTVLQVYADHIRIAIQSTSKDSDRDAPEYWETDLYLPDSTNLEDIELELTLN